MNRRDLEAKLRRQGLIKDDSAPTPPPTKYHNVRCEAEGETFDSKLERDVCAALRAAYGRSRVIRQVSIPIGKQRIRPDFMVIREHFDDGTLRVEFVDAKGRATEGWRAKANHLEDMYGIEIRIVEASR